MKIKFIFFLISTMLPLFFPILLFASAHHSIRLAIFDNPQSDPSNNENTKQFVNSYMAGINTAITVAANKGIEIIEKEFFHENNLASIIQQVSNVKSWKPDVVIGLSTSNDFLMSKAFFENQLILSISATDPALSSMPLGFYSLGIPDTDTVEVVIKFIDQHYPNSNLFIATTAESKESVDFSELLSKNYKKIHKERKIIERKFLMDDIDDLSFSKFMAGYQKNDIIIIMSIGYNSAIKLMNKISSYLNPIKPIFITSIDNWGGDSVPQDMVGTYNVFRIDTLSGGESTKDYNVFCNHYRKIYHTLPKNKISFVTYQAVMSFVEAYIQFQPNHKLSMKAILLESYLHALNKKQNWYRPPYYIVYKLENQKEIYFEKIVS